MPTTTMDWRVALQFSGVGVAIVLVLWLAGFIGSFWAGLGILAIGNMFVAAAYLPKWRRVAIGVVVVWTGVVVVKPIIWNSLPTMVQDALSSRKGAESTRFSETVRGHGGDAMVQLALYCSEREKQYTIGVEQLRHEINSLLPNDPTRSLKEVELQQRVKNIEAWRQKCTKDLQYKGDTVYTAVGSFMSAIASAFHPDNAKEWYDLLGILLLAGSGLFVATWKGPWTKSLGGAMLLAFLFFLGRYVLFETKLTKPIQEMWALTTRELTPEEKEEHRKRAEQARALAATTAVSSSNPNCTRVQTRENGILSGYNAVRAMIVENGCTEFYFEQHTSLSEVLFKQNPCSAGKVLFLQRIGGSPQVDGFTDVGWVNLDEKGIRIPWRGQVSIQKSVLSMFPSTTKLSCVS